MPNAEAQEFTDTAMSAVRMAFEVVLEWVGEDGDAPDVRLAVVDAQRALTVLQKALRKERGLRGEVNLEDEFIRQRKLAFEDSDDEA